MASMRGQRIHGSRSRHLRSRASEAGFQLVELMVVLVIFGMVLAAAVPSFVQRNSWQRSEGAAREMGARISIAREMTIGRRIPYRLVLNRPNHSYTFERQESDSSWVRDPDRVFQAEGVTA